MDTSNELWSQWESKHALPEQIKRQKRASDKKLTPLSVDFNNNSGSFKGTQDTYITTLSLCTCTDFARRKLPCKHMYRLAHELNMFKLPDEVIHCNDEPLDKNKAMDIIQSSLTKNEQLLFRDFCYHCGNDSSGEMLLSKDFADKLISLKLACEVTDTKTLLGYLHINEVRKFLPPNTKSPRRKVDLIELVAPLVKKDDIVYPDGQKCMTLHPRISHLGHTLHRKLCALYPSVDEIFLNI